MKTKYLILVRFNESGKENPIFEFEEEENRRRFIKDLERKKPETEWMITEVTKGEEDESK